MFGTSTGKTQTSTGTQTQQTGNKATQNTQRNQNKLANNRAKQERKLPANFLKAHEEFAVKTSKKMTVTNICKGLDITNPAEFATMHSLDATKDCYRIHLLGTCPRCPRNHTINTNFKRDVALESLKKATIA